MKNPKVPSLVAIGILTAITSVFWIVFSVYRIFANKPSPSVSSEILEPLAPSLDKDTIDKVQSRLFFEDSQIPQTLISNPATSKPTPPPAPTQPAATPSASPASTPSATRTATGSGGLP